MLHLRRRVRLFELLGGEKLGHRDVGLGVEGRLLLAELVELLVPVLSLVLVLSRLDIEILELALDVNLDVLQRRHLLDGGVPSLGRRGALRGLGVDQALELLLGLEHGHRALLQRRKLRLDRLDILRELSALGGGLLDSLLEARGGLGVRRGGRALLRRCIPGGGDAGGEIFHQRLLLLELLAADGVHLSLESLALGADTRGVLRRLLVQRLRVRDLLLQALELSGVLLGHLGGGFELGESALEVSRALLRGGNLGAKLGKGPLELSDGGFGVLSLLTRAHRGFVRLLVRHRSLLQVSLRRGDGGGGLGTLAVEIGGVRAGAHAAAPGLGPASGHGAGGFDELALERDHPSAGGAAVGNLRRGVEVVGNRGVSHAVVKGNLQAWLGGSDEVDEPRRVGRRGRLACLAHASFQRSLLLEDEKGGDAEVVGAEVRYARLGIGGGFNHDVIERRAGGRDGDVVLLVDGAQVTEAAEDTLDLPPRLRRHQRLDDDALALSLVRRGLALRELTANLAGHLVRALLLVLRGGLRLAALDGSSPFALESGLRVGDLLSLGLRESARGVGASLGLLEPRLGVLLLGREEIAFGDGDVHGGFRVGNLTFPRGQRGLRLFELGADGRHLALEGLEHGVQRTLLLLHSGLELSLLRLEQRNLRLDGLALLRHVVSLLGILGDFLVELLGAGFHILEILPVLDVLALKLGEFLRGAVELVLERVQLGGVRLDHHLEFVHGFVVLGGFGLFLLELAVEVGDGLGNLGDVIGRILDVHLVRDRLMAEALALLGHEGFGFAPGIVQDVLLLLDELEAVHLAGALLVELLERLARGVDGLDVLVGADDVLEVL